MLYEVIPITLCFSILDRVLTYSHLEGVYYILHALHNAIIVAVTWPDVVNTFTNVHHLDIYPTNWTALHFCLSLHLYHTLLYWTTFRVDDWLHHGLMIGVALPLSGLFETHTFLGMSLFFTTGLPGGIDYTMLALVRNGYMDKQFEKRVNAFLNVWIRSPGCVAVAVLGIALQASSSEGIGGTATALAHLVSALLAFWNGQYFMRQIVENYALLKIEGPRAGEPKA